MGILRRRIQILSQISFIIFNFFLIPKNHKK